MVPCKNYLDFDGEFWLTSCSNYQKIPDLLKSGKLDIDTVNTAVSRLLRAKFEMGLFENPYPAAPEKQWHKLIHSSEAVKLARKLDKESIVLLENHNTTLPLSKSGNIAVIGPMAHGFMNVSIPKNLQVSPENSINERVPSTAIMLSTKVNSEVSLHWMESKQQLEARLK